MDRSVVSRLADVLEDRGWLRRERHRQDQRSVQLVLTDRGLAAAHRVAGAACPPGSLLDGVPDYERDNVLRALEVLTGSLTKTPAKESTGA